jgi:hypothetical protein
MIISMRPHATRQEIDHVCERIREFGYKVHSIEGEERVVIGAVGMGDVTACLESLEATPGVERAVRISAPYKFVSKEFKPGRSLIKVNGVEIGGDEFVMMAGPCSVESEEQIMRTAESVAAAGARVLRGGAFKPRTSPYDFQGLELEGLKLLRKAKQATGLGIVTEIMSDRDVGLVAEYCDCMQVGARNMQNFALLKSLGSCGRTVLLKRGMSSTIKGTADVGRIHSGSRQPQRDSLRAGDPNLRDRDAEHLRHLRHPGAQRNDAPAGGSRPEPRRRQAQPGPGPGARRRGGGGGRVAHRGASLPGEGRQRWSAVPGPRRLPRIDVRA